MAKTSTFSWQPLITALIAALNVALVGYIIMQYQSNQQALIHTLEASQTQYQQQQLHNQEQLQQLQQELQALSYQTQQPTSVQTEPWQQCATALRISYYHMVFLGHTQQSLHWLQNAINISEHLHTPKAGAITKKLIALQNKLRHETKPSRAHLISTLHALQQDIDTLKILPSEKVATAPTETPQTPWQDWLSLQFWHDSLQHQAQQTINTIYDGISINSHPSMQYSIVDDYSLGQFQFNARMLLAQAQWAVLYQDANVYQQAITNLITSIQKHFPTHKQARNLIKTLTTLQKASIQTNEDDYIQLFERINEQMETSTGPSVSKKAPSKISAKTPTPPTHQHTLS